MKLKAASISVMAFFSMATATSVNAETVDWTPFFKEWENQCNSTKAEELLQSSLISIKPNGRVAIGKVALPEEYKNMVGRPRLVNRGDHSEIILPAKGEYYGMEISEIGYYAGHENGINGKFIVLNEPISKVKHALKKVKFLRSDDEFDVGVEVNRRKGNGAKTNVVCDSSM